MKNSLIKKLETLAARRHDISQLLTDANIVADQQRFRELSKEYAQLQPEVSCFEQYQKNEQSIVDNQALLKEQNDAEFTALIEDDLVTLNESQKKLMHELEVLLIPNDPDDERNVFLEIRAGTGGNEAALFAGDLLRMYIRFAELKSWKVTIISEHEGEQGGFKEVIARVVGEQVYSQLKFESGTHRVQRVPTTESQGRIHTSACTVAILPELEQIDVIDIDTNELRIDTFRSSGAGGQHVNTTDSAIRITHLPTGIVVECQDERSQHKNKARALSLLQAKLLATEKQKRQQ